MTNYAKVLLLALCLGIATIATVHTETSDEVLRWGIVRDYVPYSYYEDGEPTGFVVDVISRILDEEGIEYEIVAADWPELRPMLLQGEVDVYGPFIRGLREWRAAEMEGYWPDTPLISSLTAVGVPAGADNTISIDDLANKRFLVGARDFLTIDSFEHVMDRLQMSYELQEVRSPAEGIRAMVGPNSPFGLVADSAFIDAHPAFTLTPIVLGLRASYWTGYDPVLDERTRVIVDLVSERLRELQADPNSYYHMYHDQFFPSRDADDQVEAIPTWVLAALAMLLVSTIFSVTVVQILTHKQRTHTADLRSAVHNRTIELTRTYEQLIQSEKMVTLSETMSGMIHEIATPLGVAYTSATLLESASNDQERLASVAKDTVPVIVQNVRSAGELIQSFRVMITDRTAGAMREVVFPEYLYTLWHNISRKDTNVQFSATVEGFSQPRSGVQIALHTYPGVLSHVLVSLFDNSILHGFTDDIAEPTITCHASFYAVGNDIDMAITVQDNGVGLPSNIEGRVMEPFFTTKVNSPSHPGLGLPSIYRSLKTAWDLRHWKIENGKDDGVRVQFVVRLSEQEKDSLYTK